MANTGQLKIRILLLFLLGSGLLNRAFSQMSITGPTCVVAGTQYNYTISGNWSQTTSMTWSVTGGTITGSSSGTPLPQIQVTFTGSNGSVTVNTSNPTSGPSVNVSITPVFAAGTIGVPTQSINYNSMPATINCGVAVGGSCTPSYTYQWQSSPNNITYTNISGATSQNLSFSSNLIATTCYRRFTTETLSGNTGYSNVATVTVYPQLRGGSVSPASQLINYGANALQLSSTGVSGGTNSYTYQWQNSLDAVNWTNAGPASSTFTPTGLTVTTYYRLIVSSNGFSVFSSSAIVNVSQYLPGAITPSKVTINSGSSPGSINNAILASSSYCGSSNITYQWQNSLDGINFTNISGATSVSYVPPNLTAATWYRRQASFFGICGPFTVNSNVCQVTMNTGGSPDINFVQTREILKPGLTDPTTSLSLSSPYDVTQTTQYFDGIGRGIQTVVMQQSPLQNDLVSLNVYDNYGREASKFLPYTASTNDGNYKVTAQSDQYNFNSLQYPGEQYYFSETIFEPSPLNRPQYSYAPGISWQGSGRSTYSGNGSNNSFDSIRVWNIAYSPGSIPTSPSIYAAHSLFLKSSLDEAGHITAEYKDNQGRLILKRVSLHPNPGIGRDGYLSTYYIYDELGNLRFVIPPMAEALIRNTWTLTQGIANELCFRYEYDAHGHMIVKKIPGAGETWMVYDIRDRLVMTQDSLLRSQHKWLYTRYDVQNRPDSTGLIIDPTYYNNLSYQETNAFVTNNFPVVNSYANELLTQTYYDDYSWASAAGMISGLNTTYTTNSSYFNTTYNTSSVYAQPVTQFVVTRGMQTGSRKEVIGSGGSQYLYNVSFFDDRGRVIQTQNTNYTGAKDTATSQYDFTGKPIRSLLCHTKSGNTAQSHKVLTKMDYDHAFRLRHIWKNIDNSASDQLIDSIQYNELGQLRAKYIGNYVDSLVYDYNIRGWLTGINKNYLAGTTNHYFGMELAYDKQTSVAPGNTYVTPDYLGNIAGTVWKTAGSGVNRKYDYVYDYVNRLTVANFTQYNGTGFGLSAGIDFSVNNLSYDSNGNILSMNQKGFMVGGSATIDQLTYSYQPNSNKLSQVQDAVNNPTSLLGDFHYTGTKQSTDYSYDGNGSMNLDNNKAIGNIHYNYLNLPDSVSFTGKGYVKYVYDAAGTKLQKITIDNPGSKKTVTTYINGIVYQNTSPVAGSGTDTLQFIAHEEGRTRWAFHKYTSGSTSYKFEYDFFEKDHLGNTRTLLTQQRDTINYLASMEAAYRTNESLLFANIASTSYRRASVSGYPANTTVTNPNDSVSKVDFNGTTGQKIGPSLLLKVMSGDTVSMAVQSYYNTNSITTTNSSFNDVLNSLATGLLSTPGGAAEGKLSTFTASGGSVYTGLNSFLPTKDPAPPAGYPKAYLNWIFLDDQFNYVSSSSGAVAAASSTYPAATLNTVAPGAPLNITLSGYMYIWVSNETQGWDVFFDNLSVQHKQGPLLEENHYYPFGLAMAGISDKALKTSYVENKYRFNGGNELQSREFSDGSGLELYDAVHRMYDPQLGRFGQIDALSQTLPFLSPYEFANDNPIGFNDPLGLMPDSLPAVTVTAVKKGDNTTPWQLGMEWLSGRGPREHHFTDGDPFTIMLQKHEHIQDTRNEIINKLTNHKIDLHKKYPNPYNLGGFSGVPKYIRDYSTLMTGGLTGNLAVTYLGSYGLNYEVVSIDEESGTAQVNFSVSNSSTIESATHPPVIGYTEAWKNNIGTPLNNYFSTGAMSKTTQTVDWTETIQWKGDKQ